LITFKVELEREDDGRWLAEVVELSGVLAYGEP
jgi:predicted RNase H-like HicB family nuclease